MLIMLFVRDYKQKAGDIMKNIHILVATREWEGDHLRYRRHRFAEYLQKDEDTHEVIWLCPSSLQPKEKVTILQNGIKQWIIPDIGRKKWMRFSRFLPVFYKKKLEKLIDHVESMQGAYTVKLWFTYPAFSALCTMYDWDEIIYDCSDLWAVPISGRSSLPVAVREKLIYTGEQHIIESANYITCTSSYLHEHVQSRVSTSEQSKVYTYENGVEFELFQRGEKATNIFPDNDTKLVLGYIGGIKPKLDFQLIKEAARHKKEWLFLFIGPDGTNGSQEFKSLLEEPNIVWTGSVKPDQVSKYMNQVDVGIMPYKASVYNKAIFPLKLFEFLAAGKGVVGMNLPSTAKYIEEGVYHHLESDDLHRFISACEEIERNMGNEERMNRRMELAKRKDWNNIFRDMVAVGGNR